MRQAIIGLALAVLLLTACGGNSAPEATAVSQATAVPAATAVSSPTPAPTAAAPLPTTAPAATGTTTDTVTINIWPTMWPKFQKEFIRRYGGEPAIVVQYLLETGPGGGITVSNASGHIPGTTYSFKANGKYPIHPAVDKNNPGDVWGFIIKTQSTKGEQHWYFAAVALLNGMTNSQMALTAFPPPVPVVEVDGPPPGFNPAQQSV